MAPSLTRLLVILAAVVLLPPSAATAQERRSGTGSPPSTACSDAASEEGLIPVRSLPLPVADAAWFSTPADYDYVDEEAAAMPLDRVGYCLEVEAGSGTQWVWASHKATGEASDTALPTMPGQLTRGPADELTVRSNSPSVAPVTSGTGWLEMWPHTYQRTASRQVPGSYLGDAFSADARYDVDDNPSSGRYGSFQVHSVTEAGASTVLAVNRWAAAGATLDIGIGTRAVGEPDWTFAGNAGSYASRRLTFYARPASTVLEHAPQQWQLIPRSSRQETSVTVPVSGRVLDGAVDAIEVIATSGETVKRHRVPVQHGRFATEVTIPVALVDTDLEVWEWRGTARRQVRTIRGVVAGDVYVVQGQSNAVARRWGATAHSDEHHFLRTFGSGSPWGDISGAEDEWAIGRADTGLTLGAVGQWATRFAARTIEDTGVPLAVINGGHGGRPIDFFVRNDSAPTDPDTNYGRLLRRLERADLTERVTGIFWLQGESDANDAPTHVAGVTDLVTDWRADLVAPTTEAPEVFLVQVRRSPCGQPGLTELRDAQRRLATELDATLLTLNGLTSEIGCHWDHVGGYQDFGDWAYAVTRSVVRGASPEGVLAPDITRAHLQGPKTIALDLVHDDLRLTVPDGAEAGFRVAGGAVVVTGVHHVGDRLMLTTDREVPRGSVVEYVGVRNDGPWIRNRIGMGLVTFREPIR